MKDFLTIQSTRFNRIIQKHAELTDIDEPLVFLSRTPAVPASDADIRGKFEGRVFAADVIADDSTSAVYEAGQLNFVETGIVNLKIGSRLNQGLINRLFELSLNLGGVETGLFGDSMQRVAASLLKGVRQRANAMLCGLFLDQYAYSRGGIKIEGTFGTPNDLKVTPLVPWTDAADARPIKDLQDLVVYAQDTYGETYDTIILPRQDLELIYLSNEFQSLYKGMSNYYDASATINPLDPRIKATLPTLLGIPNIILSDAHYKERNANGTIATTRVHPLGKVILTSASHFNNPDSFDWANGVVTESIVSQITGYNVGLQGNLRGPVGYIVPENIHLDPPAVVAFATQRGFPRKHNEFMNAVLTVR